MSLSFKDTAAKMDAMYPATTMTNLLCRFRYQDTPVGFLPPVVSFKVVANRLDPTFGGHSINFIHYNTWLLQLFDVCDFKNLMNWKATDLLALFNIPHAGFINHLLGIGKLSPKDLCAMVFPPIVTVCGVSPDPAYDTCCLSGDIGSIFISKFTDAVNYIVDNILNLVCTDILALISDISSEAGSIIAHPKSKPSMVARGNEIGPAVANYDIVSLVEVWVDEQRQAIVKAVSQQKNIALNYFTGPPDPGPGQHRFLGSGILTFSPRYNSVIKNGGNHAYDYIGVERNVDGLEVGPLVDSDELATKGIQFTIIQTENGFIDLYSTHLSSGGDGIFSDSVFVAPTAAEKAFTRLQQLTELQNYIASTHNPAHIAVIAGDFNVAAANAGEYQNIINTLCSPDAKFVFNDWWNMNAFHLQLTNAAYPQYPSAVPPEGHTNRSGADGTDPSKFYNDFNSHCKAFPTSLLRPALENPADFYCDEGRADDTPATGDRIDYIFIEQPSSTHTFTLDASRIRRRAFLRNGVHTLPDELYLSDHLGLEITFYTSPK